MALRDQPARAAHRDDEGQWWAAPVVVIPVLALIANVGAYALAVHGAAFVVRFDIIGGFSYGMPSLFPILEALILAFGLWWCTPLSPGRAVVAAVILLVFRIAVTFAVVYVLSLTTPKMSDAFLTESLGGLCSPRHLDSLLGRFAAAHPRDLRPELPLLVGVDSDAADLGRRHGAAVLALPQRNFAGVLSVGHAMRARAGLCRDRVSVPAVAAPSALGSVAAAAQWPPPPGAPPPAPPVARCCIMRCIACGSIF